MTTRSKRNCYAQVNLHVGLDDTHLIGFVDRAKKDNVPLSVMAKAAIDLCWKHFPNEVIALANEMNATRVPPAHLRNVWEENRKLKEELEELKKQQNSAALPVYRKSS